MIRVITSAISTNKLFLRNRFRTLMVGDFVQRRTPNFNLQTFVFHVFLRNPYVKTLTRKQVKSTHTGNPGKSYLYSRSFSVPLKPVFCWFVFSFPLLHFGFIEVNIYPLVALPVQEDFFPPSAMIALHNPFKIA